MTIKRPTSTRSSNLVSLYMAERAFAMSHLKAAIDFLEHNEDFRAIDEINSALPRLQNMMNAWEKGSE